MKEKLVLITVGLLLQIVQLFKNKTKLTAKQALLNIARQLSALSPTDLIKNFDKLQDYGICIGNAFASQKCTSILKPKQSVIISKLYELKIFNFRGELQQLKKLVKIKRPTFFTLNDKFSSIPILETVNLPTITTRFQMKSNTVNKASYIKIIVNLVNFFKNIQLPYTSQTSFLENYLPEGTKVTIFGKYKRQATGNICCDKPIMMGTSKDRIIEKLQVKVQQLKFEKFALIFGITFCLGFGLKQLYNYVLDQRKKREDPLNKLQDVIYVKSRVCFNCHKKLSNFIIQKCGHLSLCKQCKQKTRMCGECKIKEDKGLQLFAC